MDKNLINKTIYDYYDAIEEIESKFLTNLTYEDLKYRVNSQLNALIELEGGQGSGKSLFAQHLAIIIGIIYGLAFDMEKHTVADLDIFNALLSNTPYRTTFVVDEQPTSFYGYGSTRVRRSLKDFEEICRYTMKNVIYVSPSEREHSSYYVFKEDAKNSVERFRNPACLECKKQNECLKIFNKNNKFQTLCEQPFWKRHGYPVAFTFMLNYPRKSDKRLMPRGYVRLPVLPPELMQKYDKIKQRNLAIYEKNETLGWKDQRSQLRKFQEEYKEKILDEKGKVKNKNLIKAYLMDYFGGRAFTTTELDIMCSIIRAEIHNPNFDETVQRKYKEEKEL